MTSIGETLRRERTKLNLDLEQVSQELKISCRMLSAIEEERFERLPGGVFSRSFVRQYARHLGLDDQEIAARLEEVLEPMDPVPMLPAPDPAKPQPVGPIQLPRMENWTTVADSNRVVWRSPLISLGLVVVAMLGCAGVYAWWQRTPHVAIAHEPASPPPPMHQAAPPPVQTASETVPASEPAPVAEPASGSPLPAASTAPVRVEMTADEPVWIEIKSDGRVTFSGLMQANESRTVDANSTVLLVLGNAGGVNISLNGKPIGSVGAKGQVRNLQLTSGGFEILPPKPAASLDDM